MKSFYCTGCGSLAFFENIKCLQCGRGLGFLPDAGELRAVEDVGDGKLKLVSPKPQTGLYRMCANATAHKTCNWLVGAEDPNQFCISCRLNEIIPNLQDPTNLDRWHRLELAKRRVIYTLLQLGLPMESDDASRPPLRFRFLADVPGQPPVQTGHANGLITLNIAEADDADREKRRVSLHEPFRTLVGHFRHEIAHYYWDRLILNNEWTERFRKVFGDEQQDYGAALKRHYGQGPPINWQDRFISAYASSHPWGDWAETWAHYFHITDTIETAASFGMVLNPTHPSAKTMMSNPKLARQDASNFDTTLEHWFPLVYALNSLNRGMGLHDLYPFTLSTPAIEKLRFVHEVLHSKTQTTPPSKAKDAATPNKSQPAGRK